ncbi:MAG: hypothetical protein EOO72_00125 [Myxococcaceae bacterium]|nr:MAG: hypothetical protein EOO72_00125 [Myxococcaceae bacterium]
MKRVPQQKAAVPVAPSGPRPLGEVFRASLSYVAGGGGGGGLVLDAAECRDVLSAIEHARQSGPVTMDEVVRLRQQLRDVLSVVNALADAFGERKAIPGQMLMGLAVQLQAIRDDGGAP